MRAVVQSRVCDTQQAKLLLLLLLLLIRQNLLLCSLQMLPLIYMRVCLHCCCK
jgi:hypothetical protein